MDANLKIALSQRPIIRFRSNLLRWCNFPFRGWTFDMKSKFCKFKMAVGRNIEIFSSIFRLSIFWLIDLGITDVESHANTGHEVASVDCDTASLRLGAPFTTHQSHTTARWCELIHITGLTDVCVGGSKLATIYSIVYTCAYAYPFLYYRSTDCQQKGQLPQTDRASAFDQVQIIYTARSQK